jgi:hypothetical protein
MEIQYPLISKSLKNIVGVVASLKNSTTNLWFGNGAGLSQRLLAQMKSLTPDLNSYQILFYRIVQC